MAAGIGLREQHFGAKEQAKRVTARYGLFEIGIPRV
jgi:hypothetical protein